ncbi:hypothetical protein FNAPI_1568 [Fusarium napiforme]|uniref:Uncharacterized protein n=1 Tax=Fusarium napiforme TaxID=42672 RepID=A0A8H5K4T5_9HYPO|nr:hypothetical protein FNAPI_1568 [Fusarium napiforme]
MKTDWFFDNPDYMAWKDGRKRILQLGGKDKEQNWIVFNQLSQHPQAIDFNMIVFSSFLADSEQSERLNPLQQSCMDPGDESTTLIRSQGHLKYRMICGKAELTPDASDMCIVDKVEKVGNGVGLGEPTTVAVVQAGSAYKCVVDV